MSKTALKVPDGLLIFFKLTCCIYYKKQKTDLVSDDSAKLAGLSCSENIGDDPLSDVLRKTIVLV